MTRALVLSLVLAGACATTGGGGTQAITVLSQRGGAAVLVNGVRVATTPATVVVRTNVPLELAVVAYDGTRYDCPLPRSVGAGYVLLQSLLVPLIPGLFVDAGTGDWDELPDTCSTPW